ncbi:MAG: integrating conjugative element protein [Pseudomonadota bacterium]
MSLRVAVCSLCLVPLAASAALTVIYDSGDTRSIAPYLAVFDTGALNQMQQPSPSAENEQSALVPEPALQLPIRTPQVSPGPVDPRPLPLPDGVALPQPFFLVGADTLSRDWLALHRNRLIEIQAIGMLVDADTAEDVAAIMATANGLPILAASASDIVAPLQITHIPVLISERGIEQ